MRDRADKKITKTNAVRILEAAKARYALMTLPLPENSEGPVAVNAHKVAELLGKSPDVVFKTLVTVGRSGQHYVFVVPCCFELSLKKAAEAVGEKNIEMIADTVDTAILGDCTDEAVLRAAGAAALGASGAGAATFSASGAATLPLRASKNLRATWGKSA